MCPLYLLDKASPKNICLESLFIELIEKFKWANNSLNGF